MIGRQLHLYDLALCDYALANVRAPLAHPGFAAWVRGGLPPRLEAHLWAGLGDDDPEELILDDVELDALEGVVRTPPQLDRRWLPWGPLHDRSIGCVREIRAELTRRDAEDWASDCARFARRLSDERLLLTDGVAIVHDWVKRLRRLLGAMGATYYLPYPDGRCRTPTTPAPLRFAFGEVDEADPPPPAAAGRAAPAAADPGDGALARVLVAVDEVRDLLVSQRQVRDYYTTEQAARALGRAPWTVREWCRLGRVRAEKRRSGRGRSLDWVIPRAELQRIEREGLLPVAPLEH